MIDYESYTWFHFNLFHVASLVAQEEWKTKHVSDTIYY